MDISSGILIVWSLFLTQVCTYSVDDESQLQIELLTGYSANVRPEVQDIVEQTIAVTGGLAVVWQDHRLSWNMSQFGNVSTVFFKSEQIWKPTLVLRNSAIGIEVIGDNSNQKSIPLMVGSAGNVFWLAPAYFIASCSVDIAKFPFDTQTCEFDLSGWLYTVDSILLNAMVDEISFDHFEENGEYDVVRSYSRVDRYSLQNTFTETLVWGIELKRKHSYYLVNIVLPVLFMQLLGLVVFVVPAESGEKLTFSLTLLLSLTVMMTLVAEKIPTTSLQIPTLSIYMLGGTLISSLEVIMTVAILYIKHRNQEGAHTRTSKFLVYTLGMLTCMTRNRIASKKEETKTPKSESEKGVTMVEVLVSNSEDPKEKAKIPDVNSNDFDSKDSAYLCGYTLDEIVKMLDKCSLVFFTTLTFVFTFAMLLKILI